MEGFLSGFGVDVGIWFGLSIEALCLQASNARILLIHLMFYCNLLIVMIAIHCRSWPQIRRWSCHYMNSFSRETSMSGDVVRTDKES